MTPDSRVTIAVNHALDDLVSTIAAIVAAVESGEISSRDGDERIARAEQWTGSRITYLRRPLEDPRRGRSDGR